MKMVIQRVRFAKVEVDGETVGKIGQGLLVLLGVADGDTDEDWAYCYRKLSAMRIFEDENGKMNCSAQDVGGAFLIVSQFTLLADTKKGHRPSFTAAAAPEQAEAYYERMISALGEAGYEVAHGVFGADMAVSLLNDGPVTIIVDSRQR